MDLLGCEYNPPTKFDPPQLLKLLYGDKFDVQDTSGSGSVVVLGAHNSGTSMVTRLIMLLGAFGGNYETISIHLHNKLKYYEPFVVSLFHDAFLGKFVDTRFRPYHGQDLNFTSMTVEDRDKLDVRLNQRTAHVIIPASLIWHISCFISCEIFQVVASLCTRSVPTARSSWRSDCCLFHCSASQESMSETWKGILRG